MMTSKRLPAYVALAAVLLLAVWYMGVWRSQGKSATAAAAKLQTAQAAQAQLQSQLHTIQNEQKNLPEAKAVLAKLQAAVTDDPGLDDALKEISAAVASAGAAVTTVQATEPPGFSTAKQGSSTQNAAVPTVSVSISATGLPQALLNMIGTLESLPRLVVVDNVALQSTSTGASATVSLRIFYANSSSHDPALQPATATTGTPA